MEAVVIICRRHQKETDFLLLVLKSYDVYCWSSHANAMLRLADFVLVWLKIKSIGSANKLLVESGKSCFQCLKSRKIAKQVILTVVHFTLTFGLINLITTYR
jgi:hypothetical protein